MPLSFWNVYTSNCVNFSLQIPNYCTFNDKIFNAYKTFNANDRLNEVHVTLTVCRHLQIKCVTLSLFRGLGYYDNVLTYCLWGGLHEMKDRSEQMFLPQSPHAVSEEAVPVWMNTAWRKYYPHFQSFSTFRYSSTCYKKHIIYIYYIQIQLNMLKSILYIASSATGELHSQPDCLL